MRTEAPNVAAYLILIGRYVVFVLGTFPSLTIDRPGAAIMFEANNHSARTPQLEAPRRVD